MKLRFNIALCLAVSVLMQSARANDADVEITSQPKRIETQPTAGPHPDEVSKTQKWGYAVTLENKTFKPIQNLEVRYIVFYKHEQLGIKAPPQKKQLSGTYPIDKIDSLGKVSFDTSPVVLTKALLIGEVGSYTYFTNGAKPKAEDSLTGIWIRVYRNGSLFAEHAQPSELTSREKWE